MRAGGLDLSGFTCAVAQIADDTPHHQAAGIAIGVDGDADDVRIVIALRHADGTTLTASLSDRMLDRLADRLVDLLPPAIAAGMRMPIVSTLQ